MNGSDILFHNVSFGYDGASSPLLAGVDVTFRRAGRGSSGPMAPARPPSCAWRQVFLHPPKGESASPTALCIVPNVPTMPGRSADVSTSMTVGLSAGTVLVMESASCSTGCAASVPSSIRRSRCVQGGYEKGVEQGQLERETALRERETATRELKKVEREVVRRREEASRSHEKRSKKNLGKGDNDEQFKCNLARATGKDARQVGC